MFGGYEGFIIPAYAISAIVLIGLIARPIIVHRRRLAEIERLESQGVKRRSASGGSAND